MTGEPDFTAAAPEAALQGGKRSEPALNAGEVGKPRGKPPGSASGPIGAKLPWKLLLWITQLPCLLVYTLFS